MNEIEKRERERDQLGSLSSVLRHRSTPLPCILMDKSWVDVEKELKEEATVPKDTARWWVGRVG